MRTIKSTGNPEQDAKLIAEALNKDVSNVDSFAEAKKKAALNFSGKQIGNTMVNEPYQKGETLLVLADESAEKEKTAATVPEPTPVVDSFFNAEFKKK
jgi:hypothetical protein